MGEDPRTMTTSVLVRIIARAERSAYDAQMRRVQLWTPWHDECAAELDRRVPGEEVPHG